MSALPDTTNDLHRGVVCLIIQNEDNKVLLGKRIGGQGDGQFATPAGGIKYGEYLTEAGKREALEETDLRIDGLELVAMVFMKQKPRNIYYFVTVQMAHGEIKNLEPERCAGWNWYPLDQLPEPMFPAVRKGLKAMREGVRLVEA